MRPFNNYGPRQHLEKVIPRFITSAIKNEPLTIHGDGLQERDWVCTQDISCALDLILHQEDFSKIKHQVIHLGSGIPTSILEIAQIVAKEFNLSPDKLVFIGDRPGQVRRHISSTTKAMELLGWRATTPLEKGLKQTIDWYKNNKKHWDKLEAMKYVPIYTNDEIVEMH